MSEQFFFQYFTYIENNKTNPLQSLMIKSNCIFGKEDLADPQIIWEDIITLIKVDFKKYSTALINDSSMLIEFLFDLIHRISYTTFYSIDRSIFLLEYYIEHFTDYLPNTKCISYSDLKHINESTIVIGAQLNAFIISKSIYPKILADSMESEDEDRLNSSKLGFFSRIGIDERNTINNIANWLFALLFNDPNIKNNIPIFFKHMKRQSNEQTKLGKEIMGSESDPSELMLNLILHYRCIQDPQSLSFLESCMVSQSIWYEINIDNTLKQLLFNNSIPDAKKKTHLIIEIVRGYLIEQYQYEYSSILLIPKAVDYTIMCYVFCYFFMSSYSLMNELTGSIYKRHENINEISQKRLYDICLNFIEYSLFIIDYMKLNKAIIDLAPEEIKYDCFYTYIEYAGLLSSYFSFAALVSCYLLKEIISLFSFQQQLPKVLFNYLSFVHQVNRLHNLDTLLLQFYNYIEKQINYKYATVDNEWYFLSLGLYYTIPNFVIKGEEYKVISSWMSDPLLLSRNIIKIATQLQYLKHYEAEILLEFINAILDDPNIYQIINTSQTITNHINQMLSYLLFHYDFIATDWSDCNFYNSESFNHIIFSIINKLSIDVDEYFYLPSKYEPYESFAPFLLFFKHKIDAHILQCSVLPFEVLSLKLAINIYYKTNQDLLASFLLVYSSSNKNCNIEKRQDKKIGRDLLHLLYLCSKLSKEEIRVLEELITSNLYHLDISLFILMQLVSEICSDEVLASIDQFLINLVEADHKLEFTYFFTIHKFFTNLISIQYDQIDYLIKEKNDSSLSMNSIINSISQLPSKYKGLSKDLIVRINIFKYQKYNWDVISKKLNSDDMNGNSYLKYISSLNYRNYPKTCINLAEWRIYQDMRELNCHSIENYPKSDLIYYYYNSYCKLDDNAQMLQSYCMDVSIQTILKQYIHSNNIKSNNMSRQSTNNFITNINNTSCLISPTSHFLQLSEVFFKTVSMKQLESVLNFNISEITSINAVTEFVFLKRIKDINSLLNTKNKQIVMTLKKKWDIFNRVFIKNSFNKMQGEIYGTMTNIAICYDIDMLINVIYTEINKLKINENDKTFTLPLPNASIGDTLKKMIQKPLSIISKRLLQYKIRRAFCSFAKENELELKCLIGIMKIYKETRSFSRLSEYYEEYKQLILYDKNNTYVSENMLYLCLRYQFNLFPTQLKEFIFIYDVYIAKYKKPKIKFELLLLKAREKNGYRIEDITNDLKRQISIKDINITEGEDYCMKANLYLENLRYINKKHFDQFNKEQITIRSLSQVLFEYLSIALKICLTTTNKKLLTVYLPQLMNYIYKIQKVFQEHSAITQSANKSFSKISKISGSKAKPNKCFNKVVDYQSEFETIVVDMRQLSNVNIKIILPQLLICYSLPRTLLYQLAVDLLIKYTNEYIDLSAPYLAAYISASDKDIEAFNIRGIDKLNYSKLYLLSKEFGENIKRLLTTPNQKTLSQYEYFQLKIKELFITMKKKKGDKEKGKRDKSFDKNSLVSTIIDQINTAIKKEQFLILLPILSNTNTYNPNLREDYNKIKKVSQNSIVDYKDYSTLFISELSDTINVISSKEAPLKITFYAKTLYDMLHKKGNKGIEFSFVLKGDVVDIAKELKSTELFNEINSIFKLKSYDLNYQMSLKQYLISPVTSHIVLVEWLVGTKTLQSIADDLKKKYAVESVKLKTNSTRNYVQGEFARIKESSNVLFYHYYLNYPNPNDWWNAKKAYLISTAVWSMTCFFAGVGDRHLGNIMIGPTGETIHIDFGYVLGKGSILPVPEIVPFRYTRNIRKNLGIFEENGLFIFIAKKAIDLFKEYYTPLISRVEYYLFDPYIDEQNDKYMIPKLDQLECFFLRDFSFDHSHIKIHRLIQESKIDDNLEKMFVGWAPEF